MQPRTVVPFMRPKKSRPEHDIPQETLDDSRPVAALDDLEAHISQRINQLETAGETDLGELIGEAMAGSNIIAPFEPFEGYDFNRLAGDEEAFTGVYDKVAEGLRDDREVLKCIHTLSDLVTDSLLNLNVRLNELEDKFKEASYAQTDELERVRNQLREMHKIIPAAESLAKLEKNAAKPTGHTEHNVADYMNELQKQVTFLKERMDRNVVEMTGKVEERQTAFLNMLDTRVKVMEKISLSYKDALNSNFFNLAILVIIIVVIAGVWINHSVDNMSNYVSLQLDALRAETRDLLEAIKPQP